MILTLVSMNRFHLLDSEHMILQNTCYHYYYVQHISATNTATAVWLKNTTQNDNYFVLNCTYVHTGA